MSETMEKQEQTFLETRKEVEQMILDKIRDISELSVWSGNPSEQLNALCRGAETLDRLFWH